ncbi:MAG: NAD(P)/FAD-dependent oxidoreductase [Bacteroidota bacterium]|nr:NAD(P)/FAD-dependent oxidoreductase [Bacteroidota bacterium]MDP3144664.1 NAD(P)/FAD-dependent oxidoreductase [Bacteroidota bacterium]MDP3557000.1 NAD(P)/FAD-dependent oxidoreductase [Bacteroidota bacterium]
MGKNVTIVGAGLVGSLVSIYLAKKGYKVNVYERRADMRKLQMSAGKSINLALSDRGWKGLEGVGIADEIKKIAIPMYGRFLHHKDGTTGYQPYGKENQAIYSVSRADINMKLMDLAEEQPNVKIHFDKRCINIERNKLETSFEDNSTKKIETVSSDLIFGADGAFAASRLNMQLHSDRFEYKQHYIDCGYKELIIPPGENGKFLMEKNALHIWPRGSFMMIALPNPDGNFTCTLFLPFEGEKSFEKIKTKEQVTQFFNEEFPDAVPLMPTLIEDFMNNPVSSLVTVKCFPWTFDNKIGLIGDAAHAIVPFYGQGMNCGFEDCVVLNDLITKHKDDWDKIFPEYESLRKPDADAIADLAIANFIEMRDKTADPKFLLQKKIEAKFSEKHPDKWIPLYSMVTYSPHIRYSKALSEGKKQQAIMDKIMTTPNIETKWDSVEIENAILNQL